MRLLFIDTSPIKFDILTPYSSALGGTESALSYLTPELAKLGHEVTLMCNSSEQILNDVKHVPLSKDIAVLDPDVVIVASTPDRFPTLRKKVPRAKLVLWVHMQPDQPDMRPLFRPETVETIDKIVYVSDNQKNAFVKEALGSGDVCLDGPNSKVIGNAVAPFFESMFSSAEEILAVKNCRGAYTSTPFRGLKHVAKIKELPIDVYSSMAVYQRDDTMFAELYERLKANDHIVLHGSVSQKMLAECLREVSFLVYPCVFRESHSIAIIEAMAAGLKIVTTDHASPQTEYIDSATSPTSLDNYVALLRRNIEFFRQYPKQWAQKSWEQVQYVNENFTWRKRAREWDAFVCD